MVNKKTFYAHWHKGKEGRGYSMSESWLKQGATYTKNWMYDRAWPKQTRPFSWLIKHFWPVPTWPENWEELVYGGKPTVMHLVAGSDNVYKKDAIDVSPQSLRILNAFYGIGSDDDLDVTRLLQSKVANNSLDLMVTNSDLEAGNPFRGQKKRLLVTYSYNGDTPITKQVDERDWLIIGQSERYVRPQAPVMAETSAPQDTVAEALTGGVGEQSLATVDLVPLSELKVFGENQLEEIAQTRVGNVPNLEIAHLSPQALNDFLIRKFAIPAHRLRGPMPIEVPSFHRDDLAKLFAELDFNRGAEIGVAEGKYSEVLLKANPDLELLCVDPWGRYHGNAQQKTDAKHEFALNETRRRTEGTKARLLIKTSMEAVQGVKDGSLDFVYLDANHSYDYFMEDLINWGRKVRKGGIISGDDAYRLDRKRWGAGPMEGIYDYTRAHGIEPWFLINAHRSVDFFYVKGDWK